MKVNLDFYKEEQEVLTTVEEEIVKIIKENKKEDYPKIIEQDERLEVMQALSMIRKNIINWYPFKREANILEINANFGEITEELCRKLNKVMIIEKSSKKAEAIEKRLEDASNLEIVVGKLETITLQEKFDYVLINGLEEQETLLEDYLQFVKRYLKEDATILFTTDNKFGLKNYNRNCEKTDNKRYITKKKIEDILHQFNLNSYKFYYPLPNYKIPNVIFTDRCMPNSESILRDLTLYDKYDVLVLDERKEYKEILKENIELFKFFANSFLVEIAKEDNKIEFVSYGNSRKEKYKMKTILFENEVRKQNINETGKEHLENIKRNIEILKKLNINILDSYDNDTIFSKLIREEKTLDKVLIQKFDEGKKEEFIELIEKFIKEIKKKLNTKDYDITQNIFERYNIKIEENIKNQFNYTKYGLYDLIFQNCFYIDDKFYFYDQEWMEENIPIEFIIYRAINYLANSKMEIDREELYRKFKLLEYIPMFEKLEITLQEQIKDHYIWKVHATNNITVKNVYDTQVHYKNLRELAEQQLVAKDKQIELRDEKIRELTNELNYMKNSKSWKMTKVFRDLKKTRIEKGKVKDDTKKEN